MPKLMNNFFNTFITILYMYIFRAISCSSSGGQIVLIQHLVSSLSVSDPPMHMCTGRSLTHGCLLTMVINIEIVLCGFNVKPKESERKMRASLDDYIKIIEHCELFVICPEFQ